MTHVAPDLDLNAADRLLTTTKQVRKRLDLDRQVPTELLLECIDISNHAPVGGNIERNQWMIVTDPDLKVRIAEFYAAVGRGYLGAAAPEARGRGAKVVDSATYLVDHLAEVPALVIPLTTGSPPEELGASAGYWGSVLPAVWSFQLAARARGLGSCWTTFHLAHAAAVAEILGLPDDMTQCALLPVAFYTGDGFTPAPRRDARRIAHLNGWGQPVG
jgi:nitroreductase